MRYNSICRGHCGSRWNGGRRQRRNRHEAMRRPVASGQGERDHERGDLAAISVAVSRATEGRRLRGGASSSTSAAVRFALPMAKPCSCRHCRADFKPERHGRLRGAVETSESCGHDGRSDLAAVLEAMPDADGRYGRRRHRRNSGRLCSRSPSTGPRSRPGAANGLSVPVATAGRARPGTRASKLWRPSPDRRWQFHICAAGSVSLPWCNRRLGEREIAHLPLPGNARLWKYKARRVHVRGRRSSGRQPRRQERTSPMMRWLHRWRERDDQHLFKASTPLPDIDPIESLLA